MELFLKKSNYLKEKLLQINVKRCKFDKFGQKFVRLFGFFVRKCQSLWNFGIDNGEKMLRRNLNWNLGAESTRKIYKYITFARKRSRIPFHYDTGRWNFTSARLEATQWMRNKLLLNTSRYVCFQPYPNQFGSSAFRYTCSVMFGNSFGSSDQYNFTVQVAAVYDPPILRKCIFEFLMKRKMTFGFF